MLITALCGTANASPNPIQLPGCSTLCVDVLCTGPTDIEVVYTIGAGSVTFDTGSMQAGPFPFHCPGGTTTVCRLLCFKGPIVAVFKVDIRVTEPGTPNQSGCPVNISVVP